MIPNRARHALFAGGAAALAWAAAEELAGRKTVRMTALLGLTAGLAAMATASVKSQSTETRVDNLVNNYGARFSNLEKGLFPNVPGGAVTLSGSIGAVTLHVGALSEFSSSANCEFLAGLSALPRQSTNNTTLSGVCGWANNKETYLESHGFSG
jgi:hypothetical protein